MLQRLEIGQQYPGWSGAFEGAFLSITNSGLEMLLSLPGATKQEMENFKTVKSYGIYTTPEFSHGLIIWEFNNKWFVETSFNPQKEKTVRPDAVETFLKDGGNAINRTLIDEHGIIRSLNLTGLDLDFIARLKKTWSETIIDWSEYDTKLSLITTVSTQKLWNETIKYPK